MKHTINISLIAVAAMLFSTSAFALTKTATMAVTANIQPACTIGVTPMAFGIYDPLGVNATAPLDATATISVQCVSEVTASLSLDEGLYKATGSTVTTPLRQMQCLDKDLEFLTYTLFQDNSHSKVWGAAANSSTLTSDGAVHDYVVYGQIAAGQVMEDGGFADTVVATVSY